MHTPMNPAAIRRALREAGVTMTALAARIGSQHTAISMVVHGARSTPYIRRAIAEAAGISYLVLWGEADSGTRLGKRGGDMRARTVTPAPLRDATSEDKR